MLHILRAIEGNFCVQMLNIFSLNSQYMATDLSFCLCVEYVKVFFLQ